MPSVRAAVAYVERNLDLDLVPDALPMGFRWGRRTRWSREVPAGDGSLAVLRVPTDPPPRAWDRFEPFL